MPINSLEARSAPVPATAARGSLATRRVATCSKPAVARSVPRLRHYATWVCRSWSISADTLEAIGVVTTELVTNAVLHSGSPDVSILLVADASTVTLVVEDHGCWREPATDHAPPHESTGNRGLQLVQALASGVQVVPTGIGTRVTARFVRPADEN